MTEDGLQLELKPAELDEVAQEARELLPQRVHLIRNGRIGQTHWFVALMREAALTVRRRGRHAGFERR